MALRVVLALVAILLFDVAPRGQAQTLSPNWTDVVRASGPAKADLELIRETADDLARTSTTFAGMLAIVKSTSWLIVLARPAAIPGKLGQTQFYIESERTFALMELNVHRLNPAARVRAIAHELAHVAEVACLPQTRATSQLLRDLSSHARRHSAPGDSTESAFPLAVEKVVLAEYRDESAPRGDITSLARRHGLSDCPTSLQESRSTSRELQNAPGGRQSQDAAHRRP
jgi:hypothetical protein